MNSKSKDESKEDSSYLHLPEHYSVGFPGSSEGRECACNGGDLGSIPRLGRSPGGGHRNPLQYSCLENAHGQRCLAGYSPWGRKESDTAERLSTAQHNVTLSGLSAGKHKKGSC